MTNEALCLDHPSFIRNSLHGIGNRVLKAHCHPKHLIFGKHVVEKNDKTIEKSKYEHNAVGSSLFRSLVSVNTSL